MPKLSLHSLVANIYNVLTMVSVCPVHTSIEACVTHKYNGILADDIHSSPSLHKANVNYLSTFGSFCNTTDLMWAQKRWLLPFFDRITKLWQAYQSRSLMRRSPCVSQRTILAFSVCLGFCMPLFLLLLTSFVRILPTSLVSL